ncbi:hypothetical protein OH77DRAFT_947771 [Trametes cingulata]|nr:hypothetical protein OH77DRAFT_947771 [Trametes cingulata]
MLAITRARADRAGTWQEAKALRHVYSVRGLASRLGRRGTSSGFLGCTEGVSRPRRTWCTPKGSCPAGCVSQARCGGHVKCLILVYRSRRAACVLPCMTRAGSRVRVPRSGVSIACRAWLANHWTSFRVSLHCLLRALAVSYSTRPCAEQHDSAEA